MKIQKVEKLVANLHDKTKYGIHIKNLKQVLNQRLVLKTVHRLIETNQKFWFKSYIDMNTGLIKRIKKNFEIYIYIFWNWWIMQFLEKLWKMLENIETLNF